MWKKSNRRELAAFSSMREKSTDFIYVLLINTLIKLEWIHIYMYIKQFTELIRFMPVPVDLRSKA